MGMVPQKPQISKAILGMGVHGREAGGITRLAFKLYYKDMVIKTVWHFRKAEENNETQMRSQR